MLEEQAESWQARQSRVLTDLRERGELTQEAVAERAKIKYWTYVRLETGKQIIKGPEIEALTRAHNLDPHALYDALRMPARFNVRAALEASGVVPPEEIDRVEADIADWAELEQRAHVQMVVRAHTPVMSRRAPRQERPPRGGSKPREAAG